uniref:Uncharacterized protein n=1 Tax=Arundo donax TaxID=35708 RepID=A0A0A9E243_ARUDO
MSAAAGSPSAVPLEPASRSLRAGAARAAAPEPTCTAAVDSPGTAPLDLVCATAARSPLGGAAGACVSKPPHQSPLEPPHRESQIEGGMRGGARGP